MLYNKQIMRHKVEDIQKDLSPVFKNHDVNSAILFGSYAKGSANKYSDVDILVDSGLKGLCFYGLLEDVCNKLKTSVDLIDKSQLTPNSDFEKEIYSTGILIYEKQSA